MTVPRRTNNFKEDLAWSQAQAKLPLWEAVYRQAFPDFDCMTLVPKDGLAQRSGIDRIVHTTTANDWKIDEKCRRKYYATPARFRSKYYKSGLVVFPDVLLEFLDHEKRGSPGWVEKELACHYIAYNILPIGQCYLLPVVETQRAWRKNKADWLAEFGTRSAHNLRYDTISCPVPLPVLMHAISAAMFFRHEMLEEYKPYIQQSDGVLIPVDKLPTNLEQMSLFLK